MHIFERIAFETLGPMNSTAVTLSCNLGRRTTVRTNETREISFLFQRRSLNIKRFNSVLIHDSFQKSEKRCACYYYYKLSLVDENNELLWEN